LYCLSFLLAIALSNNTISKSKKRKYNGQKKGQSIQWPK
jgi:hypothetical protein